MFLLYTLVTGVSAAYCLLAIWVAVGRGHWFARACVLLGALALLVPIRAYEPLVLFGMTSMVLVTYWGAVRAYAAAQQLGHKTPEAAPTKFYRFGLADLLLACVIAALASWMISVLVAHSVSVTWWRAAGSALLVALVATLAAQVAWYRSWWWRVPLLVAGVGAADAVDVFSLRCWLFDAEMLDFFQVPPYPQSYALIVFAMLYGPFALFCLAFAALAVAASGAKWNSAVVALRVAGIGLAATGLLYLGWFYARMLVVPHYVAGNPDRDNVLPRIIELGAAVEKASPDESDAIYTELFVLLDRPSCVAWPAARPNETKLDADPKLRAGRQLMRGLKARRDRLISEGKVDEATDQCVAIVRLAPMLDHKGIAIHRLEADAVRHYGHAWIAKDRERLSPDKARETAQMIVAIDEGREPIADTNLRNREWHNQLTWRHVFKRALFAELQDRDMHSPMVRAAADMGDRTQCFSRLLALDLLIRAHRAEYGAWPKSLMEVAGAVRSEGLSIDPFSDAPFIYRVESGGFVLYSVGVDGIDNGGVFPNPFGMNTKGVDLDVDAMIRP